MKEFTNREAVELFESLGYTFEKTESILNVINKVYTSIIEDRTRDVIHLTEENNKLKQLLSDEKG